MRFISKSAIVIKTESLFTLTSKWHHYPHALTCFEDLRLIQAKLKDSPSLPPQGLVGSSCRYEFPPGSTSKAELQAVESSSLNSDCAQWESWNMCLCFNQTTTRLQSHIIQQVVVNYRKYRLCETLNIMFSVLCSLWIIYEMTHCKISFAVISVLKDNISVFAPCKSCIH